MFNFINKFRHRNVNTHDQLELDKLRLAYASDAAMQLHFDRMQTALSA